MTHSDTAKEAEYPWEFCSAYAEVVEHALGELHSGCVPREPIPAGDWLRDELRPASRRLGEELYNMAVATELQSIVDTMNERGRSGPHFGDGSKERPQRVRRTVVVWRTFSRSQTKFALPSLPLAMEAYIVLCMEAYWAHQCVGGGRVFEPCEEVFGEQSARVKTFFARGGLASYRSSGGEGQKLFQAAEHAT